MVQEEAAFMQQQNPQAAAAAAATAATLNLHQHQQVCAEYSAGLGNMSN